MSLQLYALFQQIAVTSTKANLSKPKRPTTTSRARGLKGLPQNRPTSHAFRGAVLDGQGHGSGGSRDRLRGAGAAARALGIL